MLVGHCDIVFHILKCKFQKLENVGGYKQKVEFVVVQGQNREFRRGSVKHFTRKSWEGNN
jgi:hypothetical protein